MTNANRRCFFGKSKGSSEKEEAKDKKEDDVKVDEKEEAGDKKAEKAEEKK